MPPSPSPPPPPPHTQHPLVTTRQTLQCRGLKCEGTPNLPTPFLPLTTPPSYHQTDTAVLRTEMCGGPQPPHPLPSPHNTPQLPPDGHCSAEDWNLWTCPPPPPPPAHTHTHTTLSSYHQTDTTLQRTGMWEDPQSPPLPLTTPPSYHQSDTAVLRTEMCGASPTPPPPQSPPTPLPIPSYNTTSRTLQCIGRKRVVPISRFTQIPWFFFWKWNDYLTKSPHGCVCNCGDRSWFVSIEFVQFAGPEIYREKSANTGSAGRA